MAEVAAQSTDHWKRARTRDVRRWALSQGRPVEAGAVELILEVKNDCLGEPLDRWTLDGLADLMWTYVPQWCVSCGTDRPKHLAETLWIYLAYLSDTEQLAGGSDELAALQASLVAYGGLDRFGHSRARARARIRRKAPSAPPVSSTPAASSQPTEAATSGESDLAPIIPLRPRPAGDWSPLVAT